MYRNNLLVPPKEVRKELIKLAHMAHQSDDAMWRTVKQVWYWPSLMYELSNFYKSCRTCMKNKKSKLRSERKENTELYLYALGDYWGLDCASYEGHNYLVCRDHTSSFVMAQEISSQSAASIIKVLEQWISKVGIPLVIRSDNGTCFTARDYVKWVGKLFIKLVYSSPYNPESNGGAESAVKVVKDILKKEGRKSLQTGLLSLNTTVKQGMSGSPMDLFIGRPAKSMIPGQRDRRITKE